MKVNPVEVAVRFEEMRKEIVAEIRDCRCSPLLKEAFHKLSEDFADLIRELEREG
jgi:hypothetical protein